jgi:hypothetical protein
MLPRLARFGAFALSLALAAPALVDLRVRPDPNQVCASRLAGAWELDTPLTERLGAMPMMERIEFTPDEGVLAQIPAELTEYIAKERIWQAGMVRYTERGEEHLGPYALITFTGNSMAVIYRSRDGGALDDGESCILTVVPARDTAQDLLFVGGDKNNEPFRAYHRVAAR